MATQPTTTGTGDAGQLLGRESALSNWAGPYVTDMLGKGKALAQTPYQAYTGPLTAGSSALQNQAFTGLAGLSMPNAASYSPTNFSSQFTAPTNYTAGTFTGGTFNNAAASQYMNPYLQQSLDPQLREASRQAEIKRIQDAGRMTRAGAYGGSRQAILESEGNRNLMQQLSDITGQGYNTAYSAAEQSFERDQARRLQAAGMGESSRQFGSQFNLSCADTAARYAQEAQRANEAAKQFGAGYGLDAFQSGLQGLSAQMGAGAIQRGIEAEGIDADYGQFKEERDDPFKKIQYMQSLLQGMPVEAQSATYSQPTGLSSLLSSGGDILKLLKDMNIIKDPPK